MGIGEKRCVFPVEMNTMRDFWKWCKNVMQKPKCFFGVGWVNVFAWQVGQGQNFEEVDQIAIGNFSMRPEIRTKLMEKLV